MTPETCSLPRSQMLLGIYRSLMVLSWCNWLSSTHHQANFPIPVEGEQSAFEDYFPTTVTYAMDSRAFVTPPNTASHLPPTQTRQQHFISSLPTIV